MMKQFSFVVKCTGFWGWMMINFTWDLVDALKELANDIATGNESGVSS